MATLRATILAKIAAVEAEAQSLKDELVSAEQTFGAWVDEEWDAVKSRAESFWSSVTKHTGG